MAFTEDWLQQHNAKMAAQRVAGAGVRVLDRPVDATRTSGPPAAPSCAQAESGDQSGVAAANNPSAVAGALGLNSKRKRRTPEQDFQKDCVKFLNAALLPYWRVVHVPNGGTTGGHKAKIIGGIRKAMGVREGFPDLMLVGPGRFVAIELKAEGRRGKVLSTAQEEWRDWFQYVGLPWFLARSIDDVIAACQDAGVPLRVRV